MVIIKSPPEKAVVAN